MKNVVIDRRNYLPSRTLGWLSVWEGPVRLFRCACLELPWLNNEAQKSCVPAGEYPLILEYSPSFKTDLWELKLVPGRSECKIHAANFPHELRGCIAPGMVHADLDRDGKMDLASSRKARLLFHEAMGKDKQAQLVIKGDGRDVLKKGMNGAV